MQHKPALVLTTVLVLQTIAMNGFSREKIIPTHKPLRELPARLGDWALAREGLISNETKEVLQADDILQRTYLMSDRRPATLFVAYFDSQQTGANPHSPRNCLPGSGWAPTLSKTIKLSVSGKIIETNLYVVEKGKTKNVVLYWYQSRDRTVASEYAAKFYLIMDSIRENRTDTALIRIAVPVVGDDVGGALTFAISFVNDSFASLRSLLPA